MEVSTSCLGSTWINLEGRADGEEEFHRREDAELDPGTQEEARHLKGKGSQQNICLTYCDIHLSGFYSFI